MFTHKPRSQEGPELRQVRSRVDWPWLTILGHASITPTPVATRNSAAPIRTKTQPFLESESCQGNLAAFSFGNEHQAGGTLERPGHGCARKPAHPPNSMIAPVTRRRGHPRRGGTDYNLADSLWTGAKSGKAQSKIDTIRAGSGRRRSLRVRSDQCSGPGGVLFASCPTASVMRRQTAAPS